MAAGGVESIRWPLGWAGIQPTRKGGYNWASFDEVVATPPRRAWPCCPSSTAAALGRPQRNDAADQRPGAQGLDRVPHRRGQALRARRRILEQHQTGGIGPGPDYSRTGDPGEADPHLAGLERGQLLLLRLPRLAAALHEAGEDLRPGDQTGRPRRQSRPHRPLRRTDRARRQGHAGGQVPRNPLPLAGNQEQLRRIALHPYAVDAETLEELVEELHEVTVENHDRVPLYITEMGWGSQNNFKQVAFEQGVQGQVKQLKDSYGYLLENRNRLDLKQVYWFSWKDLPGLLQLLRLGRPLPRRPEVQAEARLARLRRAHRAGVRGRTSAARRRR